MISRHEEDALIVRYQAREEPEVRAVIGELTNIAREDEIGSGVGDRGRKSGVGRGRPGRERSGGLFEVQVREELEADARRSGCAGSAAERAERFVRGGGQVAEDVEH